MAETIYKIDGSRETDGVDKISKTKIDSHIAAYTKQMYANNWEEMPQYFVTSATDGLGKESVLEYIGAINDDLFKNNLL